MDKIFSEFPDISYKEWKNKVNFDLKGEDFNSTLNYLSLDGINIPSYLSSDKQSGVKINSNRKNKSSFSKVFYLNEKPNSFKILNKVLEEETESIHIYIPQDLDISELLRIEKLFESDIHLEFEKLSEKCTDTIQALSEKLSSDKKIYLNQDFISAFAKNGKLDRPLDFEIELQKSLMQIADNVIPYSIDSKIYQNAGANITQQLAYSMALYAEYINLFGIEFINKVKFNLATGSEFFPEIAKTESLSFLISYLNKKYYNSSATPVINCESSLRNKSIYDPYNNILRSVNESMAAIIAKADYIDAFTYDSVFGAPNVNSDRIAINQLRILRDESYLMKVENITTGTYYLDYIKNQFSEKAIEIFKSIELGGGFFEQIKKGIIQKKVKESSLKEQELFDNGDIKLIGVNCFINGKEKMNPEIRKYPFMKHRREKTFIPKLTIKRLAEKIEKERLENESNQN